METLNTHSDTPVDTSEHDAAMIAKAESAEAAGQERPEWLPEKFKSVEDMAKAYSELEKKMSGPKEDAAKEETPEYSAEAAPNDAAQALDNAGLDFEAFSTEYAEKGSLTEESYKALADKGFSKDLVDSWIAGQEAIANSATQAVYNQVGGADTYAEMMTWASQNMTEAEINSYNNAVDSGDINLINLAVQGLQSRYRSVEGNEPKLVQGNNAPTTSGAFQSAAEITAAMRDPRYHADPAYRKQVAEKLSRSSVF